MHFLFFNGSQDFNNNSLWLPNNDNCVVSSVNVRKSEFDRVTCDGCVHGQQEPLPGFSGPQGATASDRHVPGLLPV